ncbi:MAG: N-acetylmuramoyl-L-alanine amidase [Candidatus Omnitrophica bacterium]|nr:N-acetylmuramoyl-L-alanine amidase [Candidatus Omnitrophota bacterium]
MKNRIDLLLLTIVGIASFLLSGCGQVAGGISTRRVKLRGNYLNLETFCKKHQLSYQYNTIDDLVRIYSKTTKIDLLLNSSVGVIDGTFFSLDKPILQKNGAVFIPAQFQNVFKQQSLGVESSFFVKTIMIDPGHGGKDPGAIARSGLKEKTINLIISKILKKELESKGFIVYLTRENDSYLSLTKRAQLARDRRCDLFVSIHANANLSSRVKGVEVYYLRPGDLNTLERAKELSKLNYFINDKNHPGAETILWDLKLRKNHQLSVLASNSLYFAFRKLDFDVKAPKEAGFYVLKYAYVPAVLFEMGYLTNRAEEAILRKPYYQKQIAQTIALALDSLNQKLN